MNECNMCCMTQAGNGSKSEWNETNMKTVLPQACAGVSKILSHEIVHFILISFLIDGNLHSQQETSMAETKMSLVNMKLIAE